MRANKRYIGTCIKNMPVKRPYASQDKSIQMHRCPVRSAGDSRLFLHHLGSPGLQYNHYSPGTQRQSKLARTSTPEGTDHSSSQELPVCGTIATHRLFKVASVSPSPPGIRFRSRTIYAFLYVWKMYINHEVYRHPPRFMPEATKARSALTSTMQSYTQTPNATTPTSDLQLALTP